MKPLRTPETATEGLPDYSFAANYLNVGDADEGPVRIHFVDHGPRGGPLMLLLRARRLAVDARNQSARKSRYQYSTAS